MNHATVVDQKIWYLPQLGRSAWKWWIEKIWKELPISGQAKLLEIDRSSLYYKPVQPSWEEVAIKNRIDEIYTRFPYFGSRRITEKRKAKGVNINRKRVQRHMHEMGMQAISPGPNLSKRNLQLEFILIY